MGITQELQHLRLSSPQPQEKHGHRAFAVCREVEAEHHEDPPQGTAKLPHQNPVQVPPTSEIILWANVSPFLQNTICAILVENLPGEFDAEDVSWCLAQTLTHF